MSSLVIPGQYGPVLGKKKFLISVEINLGPIAQATRVLPYKLYNAS